MNISERGLELIKSFERCRLVAYKPTPNDVWTIGWGATGTDIGQHTVWTQQQADERLDRDISKAELCVSSSVTSELTQNEFDAAVSLCYNIGCGAFRASTFVHLLNMDDHEAAAQQFGRWSKQGGIELTGLVNRRKSERDLFETT